MRNKITTREELSKKLAGLKKEGKKIGFTSGVFDIIHAGHADFLQNAKNKCDILIVAINSDNSVKRYKGENRPLINQDQRAAVLSALECVNYVFIFDERRNKENIEILKPDFYFKAGDYSADQLTSKEIVESYGGQVVLILVKEDISTTKIITRIIELEGGNSKEKIEKDNTVMLKIKNQKARPAIFLDRDGTINEDAEYVSVVSKFKFLKNAVEGVKKFQDMGYALIIITNQAGIGLGYFRVEDFYKVNSLMLKELSRKGITLDKIYFCPHSKTEKCTCKKPNTALIDQAAKDMNIDINNSYMIGDKTQDIMLGKNAGIKTILVKTGKAGKDGEFDVKPDLIADDLIDAAKMVLENERK